MEPFAELARLAIDEEPRLAEGASESEARSLLADLAGESAALSTHGDVIARLLGPAAPAKKASIWALAADGGRPLRYIPPG